MATKLKCLGVWSMVFLVSVVSLVAKSADLKLVEAAKQGDREAVRSRLKQHSDVNSAEADGSTALAWAAYRDDLETADLLIRAGAKANTANDYGSTPLLLACENGSAAMVGRLLKAGANPNVAAWSGESPLMRCSHTGSVEAVKSLLAAGANVNAKDNREGHTALMWAAVEKHPDVVRTLVERGSDVNAHTENGFTPLLFASQQGDMESARILLEAKANVNAATPDGDTALLVASGSGHEALSIFLLDKGANPNAADSNGITPLHYAMLSGLVRMSGLILVLKYATYLHRVHMPELVKALFAHGADPNARLKSPTVPFESGVSGYSKIMRFSGIPPGRVSPIGATAFMMAASTYDVGLMRLLVAKGADPSLTTEEDVTALMLAAGLIRKRDITYTLTGEEETRALEAVKLTLELGGNVNAAEKATGLTALHAAAFCGADRVVQFLVENGANLEAKDKSGQTPLLKALNIRPPGVVDRNLIPYVARKSTAELLLKLGAKPPSNSTGQAAVAAVTANQ